MRLAVSSMAFGKEYLEIAKISYPTFEAYARKIGADFVPFLTKKYEPMHCYWEKLQIGDLLGEYDRVVYLDADMVVNPNAPSIFSWVPEDEFGGWNEMEGEFWHHNDILSAIDLYGAHPSCAQMSWYFNAGCMVASRRHIAVFSRPDYIPAGLGPTYFPEQNYFNIRVASLGIKFCRLDRRWNQFCVPRANRMQAFIIHYAGYSRDKFPVMKKEMVEDLENWRRAS